MTASLCYFMAESCRRGHIPDCPMHGGRDPWAEKTEEKPTAILEIGQRDLERAQAEYGQLLSSLSDSPRFWTGNFSLGDD